jgi:endonuclease-3
MPKTVSIDTSKKTTAKRKKLGVGKTETIKSTVSAIKTSRKTPPDKLMPTQTMQDVLTTLVNTYEEHPMEILTRASSSGGGVSTQDPYKVMIACILSLRTKDETMVPASERLFSLADTPKKMVTLSPAMVEKLIFPVGFYKTKAITVLEISKRLLAEYHSIVPDTIDELLTFKGVGRKTANLVVGLGYGKPAICVDIHVHRISNRLGYLQTKDPEETEMELRRKLPVDFWPIINKVLVLHGQQTCRPIGPRCDSCPVADVCQKIDVIPRKVKPTKSLKGE